MKKIKNFSIENKTIKIDEGVRRTGKDEMNLIELPFTLLTKRNSEDLKTIERNWIGKDENGNERKFYKIITGSDKWGLPTFIAEELFLACMELSHKYNFENRKVNTTQYKLISLMGWPNDGRSYERLIKAFNQLAGIFINTNAFWDNETKTYRKLGFGIIDDYMFFEEEKKSKKVTYNQYSLPLGHFRWNEIFFEHSLEKSNIKTIDIELYFSLNSYIAKRLYRYADKKLYQQEFFEIDLFRLAFEKLEMTGNYKYPSQIIQKLQPAIQELKDRNIANIEIKSSKTESGWKVCFKPITNTKSQILVPNITDSSEITKTVKRKTNKTEKNNTASELVKYFHFLINPEITNFVGNTKEIQQAEELLLKYNQEEIKQIIDYAIDQAKKTKFDMQYFGAILNYSDKASAQIKHKADQEEKAKKLKTTKAEQKRLEQAYEEYCQKQFDDYIAQLSPEEHQQELKNISEQVYKNIPFFTKKDSKLFRSVVESHFQQRLIEQGKIHILPFEDWNKS